MNAGYVRLSKDDDKHNYISIENQKLIINQYASSQDTIIDVWYEDDGVSGYKFNRPGFNQLLIDLDTKIDTVFVKDFSRLGRHNAKVLLLIDEFQERGKRLIVIDDNYDSIKPDDDIIGIKTWYNERYVKDASKKIKSAMKARQMEGTLLTLLPFGYKRNNADKHKIEIIDNEAEYVRKIFDLYLDGFGYRKIASYMTERGISTPSMIRHEKILQNGKHSKRQIADIWSDGMIKDVLCNDFYIGTLRMHKRARTTIHGKDKRIPKEEQFIFENNHPAIIEKEVFRLVQEMKSKRYKNNYRDCHRQWSGGEISNLFGNCLYCKDCGSHLTPVKRKTSTGFRAYYICSRYNAKGRQYCSKAHLIENTELINCTADYINLCRKALYNLISSYTLNDFKADKENTEDKVKIFQNLIVTRKNELKCLLSQKIKDIARCPDNLALINESYTNLQNDLVAQIKILESRMKESEYIEPALAAGNNEMKSALEVIDQIIDNKTLHRRDIELLIDRIEVTEHGLPEIYLKNGLTSLLKYNPALDLNYKENQIISSVMQLIYEEKREYTSVKYLSSKLTEMGLQKDRNSVLPYINFMLEQGILEKTADPLKPYSIFKKRSEIKKLIVDFKNNTQINDVFLASYNKNLHT